MTYLPQKYFAQEYNINVMQFNIFFSVKKYVYVYVSLKSKR